MKERVPVHFVVCLDDDGYPASLEVGKLYRLISDVEAKAEGLLRVIVFENFMVVFVGASEKELRRSDWRMVRYG